MERSNAADITTGRKSRRLILVGAGHAHLYTLKRINAFVDKGYECILVAPDHFWYSGLATGMVGGHYPPELDQVDVGALVGRGGGQFIRDRVSRIDIASRTLHMAGGGTLDYDVLSLNVGSQTPAISGEQDFPDRCFAAKPIARLWALHQAVTERLARQTNRLPLPHVVIAGGGATAFELAGNLLALGKNQGRGLKVTVMASGQRVLQQLSPRAARSLVASLERRDMRLLPEHRVESVTAAGVRTSDGKEVPCDIFVNATGLLPRRLASEAGLPVNEDGAMIVDSCLRSIGDSAIFGGGDSIAPRNRKLARIGVYAIRQAPVLFKSLQAALAGRPPPSRFKPQRRYLWIMNLGDGTALAARGSLWWRGKSAFWLKDRIDRRFLRHYSS